MQAVQVETVESGLRRTRPVVVFPQPADEVEHVGVAPHPLREAAEAVEGLDAVGILALVPDKPVHAVRVRPVGLDGHAAEPLLADQPPRDLGASLVELVGPVGGLADEDEAGVADRREQGIEAPGNADQRERRTIEHRFA